MVKAQKTFNKILLVGAAALGGLAVINIFTKGNIFGEKAGEGSLGGTDEQFQDDFLDLTESQGFVEKSIDPNTIPEQPDAIGQPSNDIDVFDTSPSLSFEDVFQADSAFRQPLTPTTPDPQPTGLFGSGISAGEASLGLLGFFPSVGTKVGEGLAKRGTSIFDVFKKSIPDAIEEVPVVGKQLKEFAFKQTSEIVPEVTEFAVKRTAIDVGGELAEAGTKSFAKTLSKKAAKGVVGSIPFIGLGGGTLFDIKTDPRLKAMVEKGGLSKAGAYGTAFFANLLGDILGGAAAIVSSPTALTGVGAAIPVVASIGAQVGTELGIYRLLLGPDTGSKDIIQFAQAAQDQGSIIPESQFDIGNFKLTDSSQIKTSIIGEPTTTRAFTDIETPDQGTIRSDFITLGKPNQKIEVLKSSLIDEERFKTSGAGFLDLSAKQSISGTEAARRTAVAASYFRGNAPGKKTPTATPIPNTTTSVRRSAGGSSKYIPKKFGQAPKPSRHETLLQQARRLTGKV